MEAATSNRSISKSELKQYLSIGIGYDAYKQNMESDSVTNPIEKTREYIHLNQHRMKRVEKTFEISAAISQKMKDLKHTTYWLVITEHWCGDAAQSLPVFDKLAKASHGKVVLRLVYRDQHPELIDAFLTNQTRSIPKLIQMDEHFNVNGIWGPRPTVAQNLVKELKANPETADGYAENLHLWYAKDKQASLSSEIEKLLIKADLFCQECLVH